MNKKLLIIILFMLFSSVFIACPVLSANEGKMATSYATDIYNRQLDHGIGRFICSTIDENCPGEINVKNENYYVFEYLRNDSNNVRFDKYAVIDINDLPEFVKKGLIDSEFMFGVHEDGYWTETKTRYYTDKVKYNCYLEEVWQGGLSRDYMINAYIEFLNFDVEEILSIEFNFDVYKRKKILIFIPFGWEKKEINSVITPSNIIVNGEELKGDYFSIFGSDDSKPFSWFWEYEPIEKLSEPLVINDKEYSFRINTGYHSVQNDDYHLNKATEENKTFSIVEMTVVKDELIYYCDNLELVDLKVNSSFTNKNANYSCMNIAFNSVAFILIIGLFLILILKIFKKENNETIIYISGEKKSRKI